MKSLILTAGIHFLSSMTLATTSLDQNTIHELYLEGEFATALSRISEFQTLTPSYSRSDSIFIAKYLAVMYSAEDETKEKGKYWMMRLLAFDPEAKLYDMYVSEGIREIFSWVRNEYFVKRRGIAPDTMMSKLVDTSFHDSAKLAQKQPAVEKGKAGEGANVRDSSTSVSTHQETQKHSPSKGISERPKKSHKKIWIATSIGTTLVAGGIAAVFLMRESEKTREFVLDNPRSP